MTDLGFQRIGDEIRAVEQYDLPGQAVTRFTFELQEWRDALLVDFVDTSITPYAHLQLRKVACSCWLRSTSDRIVGRLYDGGDMSYLGTLRPTEDLIYRLACPDLQSALHHLDLVQACLRAHSHIKALSASQRRFLESKGEDTEVRFSLLVNAEMHDYVTLVIEIDILADVIAKVRQKAFKQWRWSRKDLNGHIMCSVAFHLRRIRLFTAVYDRATRSPGGIRAAFTVAPLRQILETRLTSFINRSL
jgi:hypothetical protein